MDRLFLFIGSGGGAGYLPWAPGTWGSLVGVLLWLGLRKLPPLWYFSVVLALFLVGIAAAGAVEKILDRPDPGLVVIDEIVGQMIVLAALGPHPHPLWVLAAFGLFRFFDILKPFPVGWLDTHLHGGLGIMLDDAAAGLYGWLILWGVQLLL